MYVFSWVHIYISGGGLDRLGLGVDLPLAAQVREDGAHHVEVHILPNDGVNGQLVPASKSPVWGYTSFRP